MLHTCERSQVALVTITSVNAARRMCLLKEGVFDASAEQACW